MRLGNFLIKDFNQISKPVGRAQAEDATFKIVYRFHSKDNPAVSSFTLREDLIITVIFLKQGR